LSRENSCLKVGPDETNEVRNQRTDTLFFVQYFIGSGFRLMDKEERRGFLVHHRQATKKWRCQCLILKQ